MEPMQVREEKQRNKHKIQIKRNAYLMPKVTTNLVWAALNSTNTPKSAKR